MKNAIFNPAVQTIDLYVTVSLATADQTGWEFSDVYESNREATEANETWEETKNRLGKEWSVCVHIHGEKQNPRTTYTLVSWHNGNKEEGDRQVTGDDEQTIKDVIGWLENDLTESVKDYSYNDAHIYQPAFAQFQTQD